MTDADPIARRAEARRGLALYFALLVLGTGAVHVAIVRSGTSLGAGNPLWPLALMWVPGLAAIVTRVARREGARDVSLRLGGLAGLRALGLAWAFPLLVGSCAYGLAWGLGLERFAAPTVRLGFLLGLSPALSFAASLALNATLGALFGSVSALGEELGWRGYMLTRLIDAGVARPVLASGLAWALWHVPLILTGQYAAGRYAALSALLFVPTTVALGYVAARVRLSSGSVWPAVLLHSAWNAVIQGSFDKYTVGGAGARATTLFTGEGGVLVATCALAAAAVYAHTPWPVLRAPGDAPAGEASLRTS